MSDDRILEVGAGLEPDPRATETLDIRKDLSHIDYPGVDIGTDRWPVEDGEIDEVIANHVVEHVPPASIGHVFSEVDRVLRPGGKFHVVTPHVGSWAAATDPTHVGTGGWTPEITKYFTGELEDYYPTLDWGVSARARLTFPSIVRENARITVSISRGGLSHELVKIPFVDGEVHFEATVRK